MGWVLGAGLFAIKAQNDWQDGRPQVAMQHYLPIFVVLIFTQLSREVFSTEVVDSC